MLPTAFDALAKFSFPFNLIYSFHLHSSCILFCIGILMSFVVKSALFNSRCGGKMLRPQNDIVEFSTQWSFLRKINLNSQALYMCMCISHSRRKKKNGVSRKVLLWGRVCGRNSRLGKGRKLSKAFLFNNSISPCRVHYYYLTFIMRFEMHSSKSIRSISNKKKVHGNIQ